MMKEPLSPSSITTLLRCPREYIIYKVMKYPQEKGTALSMGIAFHAELEGDTGACDEALKTLDANLYPWRAAIDVMIKARKDAWEKDHADKQTISSEIKFGWDSGFRGIVDRIAVDKDCWYIVEDKTAGKVDPFKRFMLRNDIQINSYVVHRDEIADAVYLNEGIVLDPGKFSGVLYTQTIKPTERLRKSETVEQMASRLTAKAEIWHINEAELYRAPQVYEAQVKIAEAIQETALRAFESRDSQKVPGNFSSCVRYGKPCPYASLCYPDFKPQELSNETTDSNSA